MKRLPVITSILLLVLQPGANPAKAAEPRQSLDAVHSRVERFVRQELDGPGRVDDVTIDRLDPRLRLQVCEAPLEAWLPQGQPKAGRFTVGVRCEAPRPWKLYVPVQVVRHLEVMTVARPLPRGTRITPDDVRAQRHDVSRLRSSWYTTAEGVVGQETRRPLRAGEVIAANMLSAPRLVRRGQTLVLEASSTAITVSMKARALEDGGRDELIRVRNLSSNRVVEARVVGRDRVRVIF